MAIISRLSPSTATAKRLDLHPLVAFNDPTKSRPTVADISSASLKEKSSLNSFLFDLLHALLHASQPSMTSRMAFAVPLHSSPRRRRLAEGRIHLVLREGKRSHDLPSQKCLHSTGDSGMCSLKPALPVPWCILFCHFGCPRPNDDGFESRRNWAMDQADPEAEQFGSSPAHDVPKELGVHQEVILEPQLPDLTCGKLP